MDRMAYRFAKQSEVKEVNEWCRNILLEVQEDVNEYFTFDFRLIGSGEKRLVTQNSDNAFDLDYNIILQKDKKGLIDNPKRIKDIFLHSFNSILKKYVKKYIRVSDSKSVITIKLINNKSIEFSFDVAIMVEGDDGRFYRLMNDKNTGEYIWNQVEKSKNYFARFKNVKMRGKWVSFKKRYLELKNMHLKNQDKIKSFSVFLETLNEFEN